MTTRRIEPPEKIRKGLRTCGTWVTDASGEAKKDCDSCPFQNPNDPAGLTCGEYLMTQGELLIAELMENIKKVTAEADLLRSELMIAKALRRKTTMPDREKVIKGLKQHRDGGFHSCDNCPYMNDLGCQFKLYSDVLALLEEQEAVEPKQVDFYGNDEWWGLVCVCPDCNAEWMTDKANTHYCPNCGIRVKWE